MKNYHTLFFDVDDTLLDFDAAETFALRMLFEQQGMTLTPEITARYKQINRELWRAFEEGKMTKDEVIQSRFVQLFSELGKSVDGAIIDEQYRSFLALGTHMIDDAMEVVQRLSKQFDLYIVTNGVSKTQYVRLEKSGLLPYFKAVFVSEDTGYQKPMKEYFDYVFARVPQFSLEHSLIIGDSLSSDIRGGIGVGLDTCWFNPSHHSNPTDLKPTYEIQRLTQLYDILQVNQ